MEASVLDDYHRGLDLIRRRFDILKRHLPDSKDSYINDASLLIKQMETWDRSTDISHEKKLFFIDLCGAATRIWEAWTHNSESNTAIFPQWMNSDKQDDLFGLLDQSMRILKNAFATGGINRLRPFTREEIENVANLALNDFMDHLDLIAAIRKPRDTEEIRRFLSSTKLLTFSGITASNILGLSSIGGSRVYLSEQAFISTSARQIIVHELAHNWAVWNQSDSSLLVSNRPALYSMNGERILEGDFIEERLYSKNICFPNPFCLNRALTTNPVALVKTGPVSEM